MGAATLGPDQPQEFEDRRARTVDVGNPHLVLLGPDTVGVDIAELGPKLQAAFASGINVEWITATHDDEGELLDLRVWERGVGETLACGTGSVAAAAAARSWGVVGHRDGPGAQSGRDPGGDPRVRRAGHHLPGGAGAQGGRHRDPSGDALLSNLLPGTLIERTFRERIILVGVVFPGLTAEAVDEELDELAQLVDSAGADVVGRVVQRRERARPGHLRRAGQGRGDRRTQPHPGRRHGRLRRRPDAGAAPQPREALRPHRHRPHRGDPRHLRPERSQPRGQGAGGARAPALPAAPPARPGQLAQPAGRWHRHERTGRDPARSRPPTSRAAHAPARGRPARGRADALAAAA